jgi:hypothetical protein
MAAVRSFRVKTIDTGEVPEPRAATKPKTLTIDIGGTGIKLLRMDSKGQPLSERAHELTPQPAFPHAVMTMIKKMLANQGEYDRVCSVFPALLCVALCRRRLTSVRSIGAISDYRRLSRK